MDLTSMVSKLRERKRLMVDYLKLRVELEDWHGVMDASADIREIDAQLAVLLKLTGCV